MLKSLFVVFALLQVIPATAEPTQVFVLRHAERAATSQDDPALSPEGVARAALLADLLASTHVRTIITTHYRRTQETAAPIATRLGINPTIITVRRGDTAAHIADVIAEVHKASGVVLVVGHSNTVAGIVAGLSGSAPLPLCETSFSNLFITTPTLAALPAVQLKFGKPDVAPAAGCQ